MLRKLKAALLLLSFVASSCFLFNCSQKQVSPLETKSTETPGGWAPLSGQFRDLRDVPGTVFDVTYSPKTVRIDLGTVQRTLKSISSDGDVLVFDGSDSKIQSLAEGQVLFLENVAVRKILAVARKDSLVIVGTDPAGLEDLFQKAKIKWKVPIHFGALTASNGMEVPGDGDLNPARPQWALWLRPQPVFAASGTQLSYSGKVEGWNVKFNTTPKPNRLETKFHVDKDLDQLVLNLNANGFMQDFFSSADMNVSDGSVGDFSFTNSGLNGEVDVDWAAMRGEGSTAGMDKPNIKLPALAKIPMPLAGLPFVMTINANLILKPGFGGKKEAAKGQFKITYNGDEGIQVSNGQASGSGTPTGDGSISGIESVSLAPHAILVGMAAPKVTLSLGTDSIADTLTSALPSSLADTLSDFLSKSSAGKYIKKKAESSFKTNASASIQTIGIFTLTAAGSLGMFPCKVSKLTIILRAGADGYLLGKKVGDKEVDLAKKDFGISDPPIKACVQ